MKKDDTKSPTMRDYVVKRYLELKKEGTDPERAYTQAMAEWLKNYYKTDER